MPRGVCQKNSSTEIFFGENGRGTVVTRPSYLATYGPKSTPPIVAALATRMRKCAVYGCECDLPGMGEVRYEHIFVVWVCFGPCIGNNPSDPGEICTTRWTAFRGLNFFSVCLCPTRTNFGVGKRRIFFFFCSLFFPTRRV